MSIGKHNTGGFEVPKIQEFPRIKGDLGMNEPSFKNNPNKFDPNKLKESAEEFVAAMGYEKENRPAEMKKFRVDDPILKARMFVQREFYPGVPLKEIYVVWFCAALQNWKALVSTNIKDNCYLEVTYNGDKDEVYIDQYMKTGHKAIRGSELVAFDS